MTDKFIQPEIALSEMRSAVKYPNTAITDIVSNGFFIVDQEWKVSSWNDIAETLLGVSAGEMMGKNF
jgi:PAS domain-containing protein